jgi:hypothetical protein
MGEAKRYGKEGERREAKTDDLAWPTRLRVLSASDGQVEQSPQNCHIRLHGKPLTIHKVYGYSASALFALSFAMCNHERRRVLSERSRVLRSSCLFSRTSKW